MSQTPSPNLRSVGRDYGFSLTELVVALAVALVLAAIGLPSFLRAYQSYQLTNAANQVADVLRMTRYEAIRLNKQVNCLMQVSGEVTNIWADSNGNGVVDAGEKTFVLQSTGNIVATGMPSGLQTVAKTGTLTMVAPDATVAFDARGAVLPTGQQTVVYLANTNEPGPGFRAVVLLPAGSIEVWSADGAGNWVQLR